MTDIKLTAFILSLCIIISCDTTKEIQQTNSVVSSAPPSLNLDLDKAEDNLTAFIKVRGSLDPNDEVIYYANGTIYGFVDGERDKPLLGYEMYNIARVVKNAEHDYSLLTNEVLLYTDLKTGAVLETFDNPYLDKTVDVLHVWNSPVNQTQKLNGKYGKWGVNHNKFGEDGICMNADIFLKYPSPLTVEEYPDNSQSNSYEASELFQFFFSEKDINNPELNSVDCTISWTRLGPWLPWMEMGQRPGLLVYQGAGYKLLEKDYDKMPKVLTDYVMKHKPEYRHAPTEYSHPNETSWTYFKKMNPKK